MTSNSYDEIDEYAININNEISNIVKWLERNNLQINISKTSYVQFCISSKKYPPKLNLHYNGTPIEQANSIKFLGLQLDKFLNWKVNVNMVCQKINRTEKSLEILFSYENILF